MISHKRQTIKKALASAKLNNKFDGAQELIERLNNASKVGDLIQLSMILNQLLENNSILLQSLDDILENMGCNENLKFKMVINIFVSVINLLYSKCLDRGEQCPLYYASLCGKKRFVKKLLALYTLSRIVSKWNMVNVDLLSKKKTHLEWLELLGFAPGQAFRKVDFDICILNGLNEATRRLFTVEKLSIARIIEIAIDTCCGYVSTEWGAFDVLQQELKALILHRFESMKASKLAMKSNAKRLPILNWDDDERELADIIGWKNTSASLSYKDGDFELSNFCEGKQDLEEHSNMLREEENEAESYVLLAQNDGDEWENISDIESVKSFDSLHIVPTPYLDAVLKKVVSQRPSLACPISCDKIVEELQPESNELNDNELCIDFDQEDFRDLVKNQRGGKASLMFKGNRKQCKERRVHRHHRWY